MRQIFYVNPRLPPFDNMKEDIRESLARIKQAQLIDALFSTAAKLVTIERLFRTR